MSKVVACNKKIIEALHDNGAALVGILPAEPIPEVIAAIKERGRAGLFGGMDWLYTTADKRGDSNLHMREAGAIICSIWPYGSAVGPAYIARYARHADYHGYIAERMKRAWKEAFDGADDTLFFVDSKPIAEKAFAAKSGLGWIGKNTLLINDRYGSFFFVGLIMTSLALDSFTPTEGCIRGCADCTRCMDKCPTGAITSPGVLDCRRCISYLTLEHKGEIPPEMRPLIGTHIFGCDVCQEVCPYNLRRSEAKSSIPAKDIRIPSLDQLADISEEEFRGMFDGTPVVRLGRDLLIRNVTIALENGL